MKKALVLWSLLLVLALLAGCGSQAADNGNDTPHNDAVTDSQDKAPADAPANTPADNTPVDYPALFERARISAGAASEDVAIQLVKAYDSDAAGLLSAMAEYPAEDVERLAWLLVYGKSYGDLDAFQQDIRQRLAQDDPVLAAVEQAIERLYGSEGTARVIEVMKREAGAGDDIIPAEMARDTADPEASAPTIRFVNSLIERAFTERASDIHLEPQEGEMLVRMRIDGLLQRVLTVHADLQNTVISRLKIIV